MRFFKFVIWIYLKLLKFFSKDTSESTAETEVLVRLKSEKVKLKVEMPFSQQTNTFVSDMLKAVEGN